MLALPVKSECFRSEFQLERNSILFVSEVFRWNQTLWWAITTASTTLGWEKCFERENYTTNFINIYVVV